LIGYGVHLTFFEMVPFFYGLKLLFLLKSNKPGHLPFTNEPCGRSCLHEIER